MSYTKITNFTAKDSLSSGTPAKTLKGQELDDEFTAIQTADALNVKAALSNTFTAGQVITPASGTALTINPAAASTAVLVAGTSPSVVLSDTGANLTALVFGVTNASGYTINATYTNATGGNLKIQTGNTDRITVSSAGAVAFPSVGTTASAANAYLDSGASNNLLRSTSSIRYKTDVEDISWEDAEWIIKSLRPVTYQSLALNDSPDLRWYGLIAEEVAEVEPRLVHYDEQDRPDGVQYDRVAVVLLQVVKSLMERVRTLEELCGV